MKGKLVYDSSLPPSSKLGTCHSQNSITLAIGELLFKTSVLVNVCGLSYNEWNEQTDG